MKIKFNGETIDVQKGEKISEILKKEIEKNKYEVVGCKFNNEYQNLSYEVETDGTVELIDISTTNGMKIYTRTLVYIMGKAIQELYPEKKVTVNYQLGNAMFCEIDNTEITEQMINDIEKKMKEIVQRDLEIRKVTMTREEATEFYERTDSSRGRLQLDLEDNQKYIFIIVKNIITIVMEHLQIELDVQKYSK